MPLCVAVHVSLSGLGSAGLPSEPDQFPVRVRVVAGEVDVAEVVVVDVGEVGLLLLEAPLPHPDIARPKAAIQNNRTKSGLIIFRS